MSGFPDGDKCRHSGVGPALATNITQSFLAAQAGDNA